MLPLKEELLEEKSRQHQPQEKPRMKKGSVYLVVTMAATLLVLALGTPRLIRAIRRQLEIKPLSRLLSRSRRNRAVASGAEQQQHKVDNFIGKKAWEVLCLQPV